MIALMKKPIYSTMVLIAVLFSAIGWSPSGSGQRSFNDQKMWDEIKKEMERNRQSFRKYFKPEFFDNFEGHFKKLMDDFHNDFDGQFQDEFGFTDLFNMTGFDFESTWQESATERILVINAKVLQGAPADIKIDSDRIVFKATIEKRRKSQNKQKSEVYSTMRVEKSFSIPPDVDPDKAIIERSKAGDILIRLPKIQGYRPPVRSKRKDSKKRGSDLRRLRPLRPSAGDILI